MGTLKTTYVRFLRKGADAINIDIEPQSVVFTAALQIAYVNVRVTKGSTPLPYGDGKGDTFVCGVLSTGTEKVICDGNVAWGYTVSGTTFRYILRLKNAVKLSEEIPFTVTACGVTYNCQFRITSVFDGTQGSRGPLLRGPQAWSDCEEGYAFQAGGEDESFLDVVMYGDNFFYCKKSHAKTADNFPTSTLDANNGYWQLGDKLGMIATRILLAEYQLVKNLGVETVEIKDAGGNVKLYADKDGLVCNYGTFDGINIIGASTFGGFLRKSKTVITADNLDYYFSTIDTSTGITVRYLTLERCTPWIEFQDEFPMDDTYLIRLDGIRAGVSYTEEYKDKIRSYIGNVITLQFSFDNESYDGGITGETASAVSSDGLITFSSFYFSGNMIISFECVLGRSEEGREQVAWLRRSWANIE